MLAGAAFSQQLNMTVSPNSTIYLDANQSMISFTATATGGVPFPGQNSIYTYQWNVQKGTSCPGINPTYKYLIPVLTYSPGGTTSNCIMVVQATDYVGNTVFGSTGRIIVNTRLYSNGILNRSSYNVTQGQNAIISMQAPTGGTPPYNYQWLAATRISGTFSPTTANSMCAVNPNSLNCVLLTNSSTQPGIYEFELNYSDSASVPTPHLSQAVIIRILPSKTVGIYTLKTTSIASTTVAATTSSSSSTTSIMPTTTISMPNPIDVVTDAGSVIVNWLTRLLSYII